MADTENLINTEELKKAVEGEVVEKTTEEVTHDEPQYTEAEKTAMAKGWVPKDQWKGDPDAWRPAKEFNDRGELIGKIMASQREIEQLKQAVQFMTTQQRKAYLQGFENATKQLLARRDAALDEGDLKTAQQINDRLQEVREAHKEAKQEVRVAQSQPQESSYFKEWAANNTWYGTDRTLTLHAEALGVAFKEENPNSTESDMLQYVEREIKKEFAHRLTKSAPSRAAPNPDGEGRQSPGERPKREALSDVERNMSDQERQIMKTIIKVTPGYTKEQYLKDYSNR